MYISILRIAGASAVALGTMNLDTLVPAIKVNVALQSSAADEVKEAIRDAKAQMKVQADAMKARVEAQKQAFNAQVEPYKQAIRDQVQVWKSSLKDYKACLHGKCRTPIRSQWKSRGHM